MAAIIDFSISKKAELVTIYGYTEFSPSAPFGSGFFSFIYVYAKILPVIIDLITGNERTGEPYMGEKKFAGALALAMIVFAVIMEIYSYKVIPDIEVGVSSFNDNWTIKEENGESVQVTLPVKRQVPEGQELVLENRIPDKFYMNGGIVFRSRQQEVEVYMEEELLYKYPEKELIGQSLPGNWNFVMLPKDCEGKTLTVKIRSPYQKFSGQIGEV